MICGDRWWVRENVEAFCAAVVWVTCSIGISVNMMEAEKNARGYGVRRLLSIQEPRKRELVE